MFDLTIDWTALLDEAQRQWSAGNTAGVRWCYNRLRDRMPVDVRNGFADLLASDPKARGAHRPRKQPEITTHVVGPMQGELHYPLAMQFRVPDNDLSRHVATLQRMGDESAARELLAQLKRAHAKGDNDSLPKELRNKTRKAFPALAREYVERRYRVPLK